MTTAPVTEKQPWLQLPGGLWVSAGRMAYRGKVLTLYEASRMDLPAFNAEAGQYDVQINEQDQPIIRLVKAALLQARQSKDGSRLPTSQEHLAFSIYAAARKGDEPFESFYYTFTHDHADATGDVLEFHGRSGDGYQATLLHFGDDGELQPVGDLTVPPQGWIRAFGPRYGFPAETSKEEGPAHLDVPLEGADAKGFWYVGNEPKEGEQRLALRDPDWIWHGEGLLDGVVKLGLSSPDERVAALRVRPQAPADYQAETAAAREEASRLRTELDAIRSQLGKLAGNV